jgi:hypothetical protein
LTKDTRALRLDAPKIYVLTFDVKSFNLTLNSKIRKFCSIDVNYSGGKYGMLELAKIFER